MFVETPQVRMPNLNFLTSNLGFDTVFVISDVEDLGSEESRADVFVCPFFPHLSFFFCSL